MSEEKKTVPPIQKPLEFVFSARKDLKKFPSEARQTAGYYLNIAQRGLMPYCAKHLPGLGKGLIELVIDEDSDTYRVIYVARFEEAVYVIDAFKKKSPSGRGLPRNIMDRIQSRYQHVKENRPAES